MAPTRFGIMGFTVPPYGAIAARVRAAEEMGFASAWVDDDLLMPRSDELKPWMVLTALAKETTRIRLGTMVSVPPFRHPSFLTLQAITLNHPSGGRSMLGFGAGSRSNNNGAFGESTWSPRERAERMDEQASIIAPLLRGEEINHEGPHYRAVHAQVLAATSTPRTPLIIAAHGERGLRTTATYADGWNTLGGQPYPAAVEPANRVTLEEAVATTRQLSERLDEICEEIGRDPGTIQRSVLLFRPKVEPLSSLDAFDECVGRYEEIGIDEIVFYWPPQENLFPAAKLSDTGYYSFDGALPISPEQQETFEIIARERISRPG